MTWGVDMDVAVRPTARGKFLQLGGEKLYVRGVTYGTFAPGLDGAAFPPCTQVEEDFEGMAAAGFNSLRTYTVPPRWLLDAAARHGLLVMVGLPWEQHVAFLDDPARCDDIERRVREGVRACAGHPAVLAYAIGNEIPASIVRWHGRKPVERWLERLFRAAKDEDPEGLVTYVNFPTTEYLELPFLDVCAFNVYLEEEAELDAYLARLQVVAGDRPLLMAEIGLDSRSNGEQAQADQLRWQLQTTFRAGCAGAMVFAWTDEWHRGGHDIEDWDFGLVRRDRSPKPALEAVRETLGQLPVAPARWPRCSVVICTLNGSRTLQAALDGALALDYPDFEVVVVDDGSTDHSREIALLAGARVISTENRGLSSARNTGAQAASGEIVAYLDDDAVPDPHWLTYLATTFMTTDHVGVGGPNLPPPGDGAVADCVANAPGNAIHVLLTDTVAEHIPGCNCAFRRDALLEVGGFDPQFRVAGDDVDLCWRLQDRGWTIGFSPAAVVWHHRRGTVRAFWRQQRGYGRAEAMLERKWPEKYNGAGHVSWAGRVYHPGRRTLLERWHVYYGTWGTGFFQRLYSAGQPPFAHAPLMPEWYLLIALLAVLTGLGVLWSPMLATAPLLLLAVAAVVVEACVGASRARFTVPAARTRSGRLRLRALTAFLFVLQSYARLHGRLIEGLRPWGRRAAPSLRLPLPRLRTSWDETWRAVEDRLAELEARLRNAGLRVERGGDFDRWDLDVRGGMLAGARLRMAVEEHGAGRQLIRFRVAPAPRRVGVLAAAGLALIALAAVADGAPIAGGVVGAVALAVAGLVALETASAMTASDIAIEAPALAARSAPAPRPPLLERIRGDVASGEVVAVVGAEATGSRAMRDLLVALYGIDESDDDRVPPTGSLGGRGVGVGVGVVPAAPVVLPLSVAENIALGRPDASQAEIERAARAAGAEGFIKLLPRGYETQLGRSGPELTDEQRQRLALARAFLQDAPVLVLGSPLHRLAGDDDGLRERVRRFARQRRTLIATASADDAHEADRVMAVEDGGLVEVS